MWFSVVLVKFHWFGINWHVFNQSELLLVYYLQKIAPQAKSEKYYQIWLFSPIWGEKMAAFWACACKLSWTLLSPARVQPLYGAGRKESSGTGLYQALMTDCNKLQITLTQSRHQIHSKINIVQRHFKTSFSSRLTFTSCPLTQPVIPHTRMLNNISYHGFHYVRLWRHWLKVYG